MTILHSVNVRAATLNDLRAIAELKIDNPHLSDNAHPLERAMQEVFIREFKKRWKQRLLNGMRTLIITREQTLLGFISYSSYQLLEAEIHHIYVAPAMRRQQLGSLLCRKALDDMRNNNIAHAIVWIPACSHESKKFYEHNGFSNTSNIRLDNIRENVKIEETQYRTIPG